jgi:hypothetical chaperone protein
MRKTSDSNHNPHDSPPQGFVAIDFGTSNSAIALSSVDDAKRDQGPAHGPASAVRLVPLEGDHVTMPTAVFYRADTPAHQFEADRLYGRAAVAAYVEGIDGRLMRSMKSILGSPLLDQSTDIGAGRAVRYRDVVTGYLRQLKRQAEAAAGHPVSRAVLGRPVFFVDDDPARDAQAQAALAAAAQAVGFTEVAFQFEPIAAALDHESRIDTEQLVLVADIGGGTSDFSLLRVGPARRQRLERRDDILANHGVHLAGTDFDRHVELASILPLLGYRALRPAAPARPALKPAGKAPGAGVGASVAAAVSTAAASAREVPSGVYFDLATWHLINTVYSPARLAELRSIRSWYADPRHYQRLMATVQEHLGHALAAAAEQAKIDMSLQGDAHIDLAFLEAGLSATLSETQAAQVLEHDVAQIVRAATTTVQMAGLDAHAVDALYFTGGSTGFKPLVDRICACFPRAQQVRGERFASVAQGLGLHARLLFGAG